MSVKRSHLPGGTRLVALIALAIAACLFTWRANTMLNDGVADAASQTFEQRQLTSLLEPVFGAHNVRIASHAGPDGTREFLVLVNSSATHVTIDRPVFDRVVTILEAAAGYNRAKDNLHLQPFEFASGTAAGFETTDLYELGALGLIGLLLAITALSSSPTPLTLPGGQMAPQTHFAPATDAAQPFRTQGIPVTAANEDEVGQARQLAAHNPGEAARIVRRWLSQDGDDQ